jgi:hypothetical protein
MSICLPFGVWIFSLDGQNIGSTVAKLSWCCSRNVKFSLESTCIGMKIPLQHDLSHSEFFRDFYTDDRTHNQTEMPD